jgi:hypothetical protein
MRYVSYLLKSLQVFIVCFLIGIFIDNQFHKLQESIQPTEQNYTELLIGFAQLITIISVTYILHITKFFHLYFEEYSPNVLFSTFLLSLQSNMIYNFKHILQYEYYKN